LSCAFVEHGAEAAIGGHIVDIAFKIFGSSVAQTLKSFNSEDREAAFLLCNLDSS